MANMMIGTGTANGTYSGQVSADHSPAVPGTPTSDIFPDSVVSPIILSQSPPGGDWLSIM